MLSLTLRSRRESLSTQSSLKFEKSEIILIHAVYIFGIFFNMFDTTVQFVRNSKHVSKKIEIFDRTTYHLRLHPRSKIGSYTYWIAVIATDEIISDALDGLIKQFRTRDEIVIFSIPPLSCLSLLLIISLVWRRRHTKIIANKFGADFAMHSLSMVSLVLCLHRTSPS